MLFAMLLLAGALSHVLPAGAFDRAVIDGRESVVPGSYHSVEATPLSLLDLFVAIPGGFRTAIDIMFVVFASGIMFGFMNRSGAVENAVGTLVRHVGIERRYVLVVVMTFVFGALGVFVGYENNIAMIPIAALLSLAIGGDLVLAAGISVAAITVGFGLSPVNPYTVGTGHRLAELPLFSGVLLRSLLCVTGLTVVAAVNVRYLRRMLEDPSRSLGADLDTTGLSLARPIAQYGMRATDTLVMLTFAAGIITMLYGVFVNGWFLNQISAVFCMVAIVIGLITRTSAEDFGSVTLRSVAEVAPGAFMVGLATSIKVALEMGQISDTIANSMAGALSGLPTYAAAVGMAALQSVMNFVIPSGSGQALATLPVLLPVGELLGLTRQTTVLAFQVGDGVSNLINPTLGGLVAMVAMCRVPFDRWLRFIVGPFLLIYALAMVGVVVSVLVGYGPF